jgi:hypothetical protein
VGEFFEGIQKSALNSDNGARIVDIFINNEGTKVGITFNKIVIFDGSLLHKNINISVIDQRFERNIKNTIVIFYKKFETNLNEFKMILEKIMCLDIKVVIDEIIEMDNSFIVDLKEIPKMLLDIGTLGYNETPIFDIAWFRNEQCKNCENMGHSKKNCPNEIGEKKKINKNKSNLTKKSTNKKFVKKNESMIVDEIIEKEENEDEFDDDSSVNYDGIFETEDGSAANDNLNNSVNTVKSVELKEKAENKTIYGEVESLSNKRKIFVNQPENKESEWFFSRLVYGLESYTNEETTKKGLFYSLLSIDSQITMKRLEDSVKEKFVENRDLWDIEVYKFIAEKLKLGLYFVYEDGSSNVLCNSNSEKAITFWINRENRIFNILDPSVFMRNGFSELKFFGELAGNNSATFSQQ